MIILKNILYSFLLVIGWIVILAISYAEYIFIPMFTLLGGGILVYITALLYILAFVLPILFRKRISKYLSMPLSFIVFTIISLVLVVCISLGGRSYISEFSSEKWSNNEGLRTYMVEDLEEEHKIVGMTDKEVLELLGEPDDIWELSEKERYAYIYYIGTDIIGESDMYFVSFLDNVVVGASIQ